MNTREEIYFSKYIGSKIWDSIEKQQVDLLSVDGNLIKYSLDNKIFYRGVDTFKIIVKGVQEAIDNKIPIDYVVIIKDDAISCTADKKSIFNKVKEFTHIAYDTTEEEMMSSKESRKTKFRISRQIIMSFSYAICKDYTTLAEVGKMYGKDHTTVINAIKAVSCYLDTDIEFRKKNNELIEYAKLVNRKLMLPI